MAAYDGQLKIFNVQIWGGGKRQVNRAFIAGECSERAVVEVICFID